MKPFLVYTALRFVLFIGALVMVVGIWSLLNGGSGVNGSQLFFAVIAALVISGVASYFTLSRQRDALAQRVEARASRAASKLDEMRSKED